MSILKHYLDRCKKMREKYNCGHRSLYTVGCGECMIGRNINRIRGIFRKYSPYYGVLEDKMKIKVYEDKVVFDINDWSCPYTSDLVLDLSDTGVSGTKFMYKLSMHYAVKLAGCDDVYERKN